MAITRDSIAAYLHTTFSSLATAIGQTASDASGAGYGPDVDNALRELAVTEADLATATVEDAKRKDVFVLAEYFAAERIWRRLGDRVDHTMNESKFDFKSQREQAKAIMEAAAKKCAVLGYNVDGKVIPALFRVY